MHSAAKYKRVKEQHVVFVTSTRTLSCTKHGFQALAKADTEVFDEDSDGMFARVEAPSADLLRIWVCVEAWRLFEGLALATAVEALGLDPLKGVMVSLFGLFFRL